MKLIAYYIVIQLIGDAIAVAIGLGIEKFAPGDQHADLLDAVLLSPLGGLGHRRADDRAENASAPLAGATSDQRA